MVSVPNFLMGSTINSDLRANFNALGAALDRRNQLQLADARMAQQQRQFEATNALGKAQLAESQRQFGENMQFRQSESERAAKQFGMSYALDKGRFDMASRSAEDDRQARFETKAAGLAQMIAEDTDPVRAADRWKRLVASDPRWASSLGRFGIDPNDYMAGAKAIIANARGYKEPDPYKTIELDNDKALIGVNPKTGETRILRQPQQGAAGPFKTMKDKAGVEEGLRKEYAALAKPYFETRDAFSRIQQSAKTPSPASDIALIFNFMKMLDPGSVVREGEFATAQNAGGVDERLRALYNKVKSGERLTPEIRADFVRQANGLHASAKRQYDRVQQQYRDIATRTGADPANTIIDFSQPGATPEAAQTKVLNGVTYRKINGQWFAE